MLAELSWLFCAVAAMAIAAPPTATPDPPPYTREDLARRWSVSTSAIDKWIAAERLRVVRLGRRVRIPHAEVVRVERDGLGS